MSKFGWGMGLLASGALLSACSAEPASAPDASRAGPAQVVAAAPRALLASPDVTDAVWLGSADGLTLQFGRPDAAPLLTLACRPDAAGGKLSVTRHAPADPGAEATLALIGNGHIARWPVAATLARGETAWSGGVPLSHPRIDVLRGTREVAATVPGTGTVRLPASPEPGALLDRCLAASAALAPSGWQAPATGPA